MMAVEKDNEVTYDFINFALNSTFEKVKFQPSEELKQKLAADCSAPTSQQVQDGYSTKRHRYAVQLSADELKMHVRRHQRIDQAIAASRAFDIHYDETEISSQSMQNHAVFWQGHRQKEKFYLKHSAQFFVTGSSGRRVTPSARRLSESRGGSSRTPLRVGTDCSGMETPIQAL